MNPAEFPIQMAADDDFYSPEVICLLKKKYSFISTDRASELDHLSIVYLNDLLLSLQYVHFSSGRVKKIDS